ncbi:hypothetical protein J2Z48_002263 [Croceifilum oryzae]|uniref:Uncharacterized protein n=1 Tax=Croceifilum oryzae TaxID=1553429 RepID=A0AAJ1TGJ0_9BACL|nr:hypothetical protein [Croceifilum oryzae]
MKIKERDDWSPERKGLSAFVALLMIVLVLFQSHD